MRARDLMTSTPFVVTPGEPVSRAAAMMRDYGVGALPVVDHLGTMHPVGILTDRDLAVRCMSHGHEPWCPVGEHMTPGPLAAVSPTADVDRVMEVMRHHRVRRVVVVDGDRLVGIVGLADVARHEGPRDPVGTEQVLYCVSEPEREAALV
jgi:CBS domain-containing protein